MKTREQILETWDEEGYYTDWYAIDTYDPCDGTIRRQFVGTADEAADMMRYYSEPSETAIAPFHRCLLVSTSDAHAYFLGQVDVLPSERGEYSITEAAGILNISRQRVHQLIESGKLDAHKVGNTWSIYRYSVENRMNK